MSGEQTSNAKPSGKDGNKQRWNNKQNERDDPDAGGILSGESGKHCRTVGSLEAKFYRYSVWNTMLIHHRTPSKAVCTEARKHGKKWAIPQSEGVHGMKVFVPVKTTWLEPEEGKRVTTEICKQGRNGSGIRRGNSGTVRTSYEIGNGV